MIDLGSFENVRLHGGFLVASIDVTSEPMVDALGREAVAQTRIVGKQFQILLRGDLSDRELSISLYHEALEAATLADPHPPESVMEFNEGDFEEAAQMAHLKWGYASVANLNRMLQSFRFWGE